MAGTGEQATLMVQLAAWGSAIGADTAAIWAEDFDPAAATTADPMVRTVLNWHETLGALVKHDLLDRELVYDWLWVAGVWERVRPAAERARSEMGVPQLYENFEALASGQTNVVSAA